MLGGVDLALEDLLCTHDCEVGYLTAQVFLGTQDFLTDLSASIHENLLALGLGCLLSLIHDLGCALFSHQHQFACLLLGQTDLFVDALARLLQILLPRSAAAKPSAMRLARSSIKLVSGGQTNFIVNHTRMAKVIACPSSVALISTFVFLLQFNNTRLAPD